MSGYERQTPPPDADEEQLKSRMAREATTRHAEANERARLANARRFAQSPEGRALMVKEFDRARGRPLLAEVKP